MLLVKTGDRAMVVGLEKKVVPSENQVLRRMIDDQAICSRCWMQLRENDFENTIKVILKGTEMVVEAENQSDREDVYFERISVTGAIWQWHLRGYEQQRDQFQVLNKLKPQGATYSARTRLDCSLENFLKVV